MIIMNLLKPSYYIAFHLSEASEKKASRYLIKDSKNIAETGLSHIVLVDVKAPMFVRVDTKPFERNCVFPDVDSYLFKLKFNLFLNLLPIYLSRSIEFFVLLNTLFELRKFVRKNHAMENY